MEQQDSNTGLIIILIVVVAVLIGIFYMSSGTSKPETKNSTSTDPVPASASSTNSTPASSGTSNKFTNGSSYRCNNGPAGENGVYRAENDVLRHYPTADIAASWNPNWENYTQIDCAGLNFGSPMTQKT